MCLGRVFIFQLLIAILNIAAPDSCPPGWRRFDETCFQVHLLRKKDWGDARRDCWTRGGRLAMIKRGLEPHKITKFIDDYLDRWSYFFTGAYAEHGNSGQWITVKNESFPFNKYSSLWGPNEPSGDGWCGDLILGEKWNSYWKGKGWRINDGACLTEEAYICQRQKNESSKNAGYCYLEYVSRPRHCVETSLKLLVVCFS